MEEALPAVSHHLLDVFVYHITGIVGVEMSVANTPLPANLASFCTVSVNGEFLPLSLENFRTNLEIHDGLCSLLRV